MSSVVSFSFLNISVLLLKHHFKIQLFRDILYLFKNIKFINSHRFISGSLGLTFSVYWFFGGIYTILDVTNWPAVLRKYKIQPGTNEPVDRRELCNVIAQVLFNQIIVGVPLAYVSYRFMEWRGYPPMRELPTFHWVLVEIAILILCEEIGFYYSHRYANFSCC